MSETPAAELPDAKNGIFQRQQDSIPPPLLLLLLLHLLPTIEILLKATSFTPNYMFTCMYIHTYTTYHALYTLYHIPYTLYSIPYTICAILYTIGFILYTLYHGLYTRLSLAGPSHPLLRILSIQIGSHMWTPKNCKIIAQHHYKQPKGLLF